MASPRPSYLGWLAFSEEERRRAHDAISLLRDRDTRDELGVAGVRDAFSELLFPGTSTIQTRAGYFLFVPWIYRAIERGDGAGAASRARRAEQRLIVALRESDDPDGTIGLRAGADVQRLPSSVYWQGLSTWGIRRFRAPIFTYHRWLEHPLRKRAVRDDDGNPIDDRSDSGWDPGLPEPPAQFPEAAAFRLRADDARYLRDRVLLTAPGTMLAFLIDRGSPDIEAMAPWAHPQLAELPGTAREVLDHAELFSLAMHGSMLLYNLLAAERAERDDRVDGYRERLRSWSDELAATPRLDRWDAHRFWEIARLGNPRIRSAAVRFVDTWRSLVLAHCEDAFVIADDQGARRLVVQREIAVKGRKNARLATASALARWSGAAGADRMTFRWRSAQQIALDIRRPLARADSD